MMADAPDQKSRAARLRERIEQLKHESKEHEPEPGDEQAAASEAEGEAIRNSRDESRPKEQPGRAHVPDSGPRPGESPNAYVERRMRETLKKQEP
jgi:hypothetical protein